MANTLRIIKANVNEFWHIPNGDENQKFAISDFEISVDGNLFKIIEIDGAKRYNYLVQDITIVDETTSGPVETFTDFIVFYRRLIELNYTPFVNNGNGGTNPNEIMHNDLDGLNEGDYQHLTVVQKNKLDYLDATKDIDKPVSTAQAEADAQVFLDSKAYTDSKFGTDYSNIVYFNDTDPETATIFDTNNPPITNNDALKNDDTNLYIGTDSGTWVYNTTSEAYETKIVDTGGSNFYFQGTSIDAGNNKTSAIERNAPIGVGTATSANHAVTKAQHDTKEDVANRGVANGYVPTDASNLIPIGFIPPSVIERLIIVANEAARFALTIAIVQNGDVVKQIDINEMFYVKDDTNLSNDNGYEGFRAGTAASVPWSGVTGTPTTLSGYGITDAAPSSSVHNPVTIGTANGLSLSTQVLSLGLASSSTNGALSSTDWNTFNNKQNALTNPITGTLNAGYVPVATGTNTIANSVMFIDLTTPSFPILSLNGTTNTGGAIFDFRSNGITHAEIIGQQESTNNGKISIKTLRSNVLTDALTLSSTGNVGIGITSPQQKVHSTGAFSSAILNPVNGNTFGTYGFSAGSYPNLFAEISSIADGVNWYNGANLVFKTSSAGDITASSSIERMRITSTGNVLIGTTTDNGVDKLQVNGGISATYLRGTGDLIRLSDDWVLGNLDDSRFYIYNIGLTQDFLSVNKTTNASTINGAVQLTNLSGTGTRTVVADASGNLSATVSAPLLTTTNQSFTGIKTVHNTLAGSNMGDGIVLRNSSTYLQSRVLEVQNDSTSGYGFLLANTSNGSGMWVQSSGAGSGIYGAVINGGGSFINGALYGASTSPFIKAEAATGSSGDMIVFTKNGTLSFRVNNDGDLLAKSIIINNGTVRLKSYTVASLPAGSQGDIAYVVDAVSPTYLGALTGGGSVVCPVFYNGTSWVSY